MRKYIISLFVLITAFCSCTNDVEEGQNTLEAPAPVTSSLNSNVATITWPAIGNATVYIYSLNDGDEKSTDGTELTFENLEPETTYKLKIRASKTNSKFFVDSSVTEFSFTTTAKPKVYKVATFADDWDKWYYDYNEDGKVSHIYRLNGDGTTEREWNFEYNGNNVSVTGKNTYKITLNDMGYAATFADEWDTFSYTYDEDGYMIQVEKNGNVVSNITIEDGNITKWSKFEDEVEKFKLNVYSNDDNIGGIHGIYSEKCGASRWLVESGLFGKASKKLHSTNVWDYKEGDASCTSVFTYVKDELGRVSTECKTYGDYPENYYFTYK